MISQPLWSAKNLTKVKLVNTKSKLTVGIIGVRGFVGQSLIPLICKHPNLSLAWISSRRLQGLTLSQAFPPLIGAFNNDIIIESINHDKVESKNTDIVILALPNGLATNYVSALEKSGCRIIIDLSADYRFDPNWLYSVPEINANQFKTAQNQSPLKISNPGCYATAMQLAIAPIRNVVKGTVHCFGISGYSGAGTSPQITNQQENIANNVIPYALTNHLHEKEVSFHQTSEVRFTPHVADFFSGISMTLQIELETPNTEQGIFQIYKSYFEYEPLIRVNKAIPTIKSVVDTHCAMIGGFSLSSDGKQFSMVSCLDNLLKGAASQAIQNINLALGIPSETGLRQSITEFELKPPTN